MSNRFDAALKDLVTQAAEDLRSVFRLPTIEPIVPLNVDLSTISAATDVAIGFGNPLQQIADINFQSGPDANVDSRLHLYNAAFHHRFRVPVRSILVLLRPKAQTPNLTGILSYLCGDNRVSFPYEVIRIWQEPVQPFLEGGVGLLPLATLCKLPGRRSETSLRNIVREIDRRLAIMPDQARAVRLMTASFVLTGLRVPKENLSQLYEGVRVMHQTSAYDWYVDEGSRRTRIADLLKIGRKQFGDPTPKTEHALTAIEDLDRLERMMDAILDVRSWKALLAVK